MYNTDYYSKNKERIKIYKFQYREKNKIKISRKKSIDYWKLKESILHAYGNKCVNCEEMNKEFLEVDHIDGNGTKHIRDLKNKGILFYTYLKDNKYPIGYQILCSNCNWLKWINNKTYNTTKIGKYNQSWSLTRKIKLFNLIGNYCNCCFENRLELLTLEHLLNDGHIERKKYGRIKMITNILKGNLPLQKYSTLCRNCNFSKGKYGYCPHFLEDF